MPITPTELARVSRQSTSWPEAKRRVISAYREWIRAAPGIQSMYSVPFPVSVLRTRIRQEFERHRYINKLPVVDVLLFQSSADYQETMNYWRQTSHIMAYFTDETFKKGPKLPASFMEGFLEGRN